MPQGIHCTSAVRQTVPRLERTELSIEEIASRTGFGTAAGMRRHFGRLAGVSPRTYRQLHGTVEHD